MRLLCLTIILTFMNDYFSAVFDEFRAFYFSFSYVNYFAISYIQFVRDRNKKDLF